MMIIHLLLKYCQEDGTVDEIWEGKRSERKKRYDLLKNKSVKNLVNTFNLKVDNE